MRKPFVWNEIEHWTGNQLMETVQLVDEDEAESFMTAYSAMCDDESHAEHNLRYIMSLTDSETAEALSELFMIEQPREFETIEPRQWFAGSSYGLKEGEISEH
jgi:hypothetical protein